MIDLRGDSALAFKYFYWSLILVGLLVVGTVKLFAWGGFTEPVEIHLHPTLEDEEFDGEKWLAEHPYHLEEDNDKPIEKEPD